MFTMSVFIGVEDIMDDDANVQPLFCNKRTCIETPVYELVRESAMYMHRRRITNNR